MAVNILRRCKAVQVVMRYRGASQDLKAEFSLKSEELLSIPQKIIKSFRMTAQIMIFEALPFRCNFFDKFFKVWIVIFYVKSTHVEGIAEVFGADF